MSGESGSNTGLPRSDRPNGFHPAVPGNGNGSAVQEHAVNGHASPTRPRDTAHAGNGATGTTDVRRFMKLVQWTQSCDVVS